MRASALLLALFLATTARADIASADAAFDDDDHVQALKLYDEVLAEDPSNVHALLRSGMLLSWDKKYDDALARYERALTREPKNPDVLLERGKVFLWSKRYDEAIDSYAKVLEQRPHDAWALLGTAQAYAWRGRSAEARPFYVRAVEADPDLKDARIGLAYADLETGNAPAAREAAAALAVKYPDDPEVKALNEAAKKSSAAWVQVGYEHLDDSDENRMNGYIAEGGFGFATRFDLRFGYRHDDFNGPVPGNADANGTADLLYGVLGWDPRPRQRGELRLGAARLTDSGGNDRTTAIGGLSYSFPIGTWTGRAGAAYDPFLYSPQILDNDIDVTSVTFSAAGLASKHVQVEAGAGYGHFSDGNTRLNADAGAWYVWTWPARRLLAGGVVRYLDFADDLNHGYFDPSNLVAGLASVRSNGTIGRSRWEYETTAEGGVQRYTFNGATNTGKPLWNFYGLLAHPLGRGFSFQLDANYGNSSAASGPGFNSIFFGAGVRYTFGG
ncbi:MAG TPA: tetratricopeptide repeat protein [Candidatus Polarisedimenticolaceae bacterium]|nr:tetratricopeptide repeat protein [Candidatus Polarisedimenticolaceae bacterium]